MSQRNTILEGYFSIYIKPPRLKRREGKREKGAEEIGSKENNALAIF